MKMKYESFPAEKIPVTPEEIERVRNEAIQKEENPEEAVAALHAQRELEDAGREYEADLEFTRTRKPYLPEKKKPPQEGAGA